MTEYTIDDIIFNFHPEDREPEHPYTPLKREIVENPNRLIFVPTILGERTIDIPVHRAVDFIKHDPLIVGVVEYSSHHGQDIMLLRPYIEFESILEHEDEQRAKKGG